MKQGNKNSFRALQKNSAQWYMKKIQLHIQLKKRTGSFSKSVTNYTNEEAGKFNGKLMQYRKRGILPLIILVFFSCSLNKNESAFFKKFGFHERVLIGKSIASYVKLTSVKRMKTWFYMDEPPGKYIAICFCYPDNFCVKLYSRGFKNLTADTKNDFPLSEIFQFEIDEISTSLEYNS